MMGAGGRGMEGEGGGGRGREGRGERGRGGEKGRRERADVCVYV